MSGFFSKCESYISGLLGGGLDCTARCGRAIGLAENGLIFPFVACDVAGVTRSASGLPDAR